LLRFGGGTNGYVHPKKGEESPYTESKPTTERGFRVDRKGKGPEKSWKYPKEKVIAACKIKAARSLRGKRGSRAQEKRGSWEINREL